MKCNKEDVLLVDGMELFNWREVPTDLESEEDIQAYIDSVFWEDYFGLEKFSLDAIKAVAAISMRIRVNGEQVRAEIEVEAGEGDVKVTLSEEKGQYAVGVSADRAARRSLSPVWWLDGKVIPIDFEDAPASAYYAERIGRGSTLIMEDMMTGNQWEFDFSDATAQFTGAVATCETYRRDIIEEEDL